MFYVALQNFSTVLKDEEVAPVAAVLKTQINRDFSQHYGVQADVRYLSQTTVLPGNFWQLAIFDNSDQAGALGYHDLAPNGMPIGKVFAGTDKIYGLQWSVTASHELLEMLADPYINLVATNWVQKGTSTWWLRQYAYEVADPCEDERDGYLIDGVLVSDFVLPRWFNSRIVPPPGERFNFQGTMTKPLELRPGGYIAVQDVFPATGWVYLTGSEGGFSHRAPVGSRRERRAIPSHQWKASVPK